MSKKAVKQYLTAAQAKGLLEDIVGETVKKIGELQQDGNSDVAKEIAYQAKHKRPSRLKGLPAGEKLEHCANMFAALYFANGDPEKAAKVAREDFGDELVAKGLLSTTLAGGAVLIEPEMAAEFVDILRGAAVIFKLGARILPMESGILVMGRGATGATAAYRGEGVAASVSTPTLDSIELRARILSVMAATSEQMVSRSKGRAGEFLRDDLIAAVSDKMDHTFINSDGSQNKPRGLLYWALSANKFNEINASTNPNGSTTAEIVQTLGKAIRLLKDRNIRMVRPGWGFSPRSWQRLFTELDGNGNPVFRDELVSGKLYNIPWADTTNIPSNLGGSTDASFVFLADFFDVVVGETEALRVKTSTEASYNDGSGAKSAFQTGEVLTMVEMEHDLVCRRGGAEVVVVEDVTWGYSA